MPGVDYGVFNPAWAGTRAAELTSDTAFLQALLEVERAWSHVLADAGLIPADHLAAISTAAKVELYDPAQLAAAAAGGGNVLIPLLKAFRAKVAGSNAAATASVHIGATSQDIIDTALMLLIKRSGRHTLAAVKEAVAALTVLATEHRDTPMVARSLTQHSLPATFGWRASHWLQGLGQTGQTLERLLGDVALQWGGAAGTRASLQDFLARQQAQLSADELVTELADRLGLTNPLPWQANRVPILEQASAFATIAAACGKIANDVLISARAENGELGEPLAEGRGVSSAMPHKQNPVLSVLIKNAALTAPNQLATVYAGAVANVEERADGGWHTEWSALRELMRSAGAAAEKTRELLAGLRVFPDRMAENLNRHGQLLATERLVAQLAPRLEEQGHAPAGFGKQVLQDIIAEALREQTELPELLAKRLPAGFCSAEELDHLLDPLAYTGDAGSIVDQLVETYTDWSHS